MQKYVPYFPKKRWPLTIKKLLGHLGGISHYKNYQEEGFFTRPYTTEESIKIFADWPLLHEPGLKFQYTSYGYNLLGAVIEGASGVRYSEYMTENVWKPLGMFDTEMDVQKKIIPHRAAGYKREKGKVINTNFLDTSSRFASGGILSTVNDMIFFAKGLDEGKVINKKDQMRMYTTQVTNSGEATQFSESWFVDYQSGFWTAAHSGGQAGTSTYILRYPGENFAVALASNLEGTDTTKYAKLVASLILKTHDVKMRAADQVLFDQLHLVWHTGLGYHSKFGAAKESDQEKIKEAFAFFNALDPKDPDSMKAAVDGLHPKTGEPLFVVGSYMAEKLAGKYGVEYLYNYRRNGAVPFFIDYIKLYQADPSIPGDCHFSKIFESRVVDLQQPWSQIWTDTTKEILVMPDPDFARKLDSIVDSWKNKKIFPALSNRILLLGYYTINGGKVDEGLEILAKGRALYPRDVSLHFYSAQFYLQRKKDVEKAREFYEKTLKINPEHRQAQEALKNLNDKK